MAEPELINTGIFSVNTWIVPLGIYTQDKKQCVFVTDPAACNFSGDSLAITDYLDKKNYECIAIVLTHSHFDHVTGILEIKKAFPKSVIAIHQKEFDELKNPVGPINKSCIKTFRFKTEFEKVLKEQPPAEIALKHGQTLDVLLKKDIFNDEELFLKLNQVLSEWKIFNTPGHTPGSICIYNKNKGILISGDTIFDGTWGRTDLYGGNDFDMKKSLSWYYENIPDGTKVFPGHDNSFVK